LNDDLEKKQTSQEVPLQMYKVPLINTGFAVVSVRCSYERWFPCTNTKGVSDGSMEAVNETFW